MKPEVNTQLRAQIDSLKRKEKLKDKELKTAEEQVRECKVDRFASASTKKYVVQFNTLDAARLFSIPAYNAKLFTRASALKPNCFHFS